MNTLTQCEIRRNDGVAWRVEGRGSEDEGPFGGDNGDYFMVPARAIGEDEEGEARANLNAS